MMATMRLQQAAAHEVGGASSFWFTHAEAFHLQFEPKQRVELLATRPRRRAIVRGRNSPSRLGRKAKPAE